ncbi:MAG: hypothetical protein MSS80_03495 [Mollicutes bacterium]|nr:hypothetical protein [Mollicutes bacterium]
MEQVRRNQYNKIYLYNTNGVILELRNYHKYYYQDFNIYDELITQQDNYFYSIYLNNEIKQKRKLDFTSKINFTFKNDLYINIEIENIKIEEEETKYFQEDNKSYDVYKNYKINGLFLGMRTSKNEYLKEYKNCSHIETLEHIIERLEEINKRKDKTKYINYLKNKIKEGYNFIKSEFPETKKEIERITVYDRKEETKESKQYNKNYDYLNKNYNNNAYIIMKLLKDLKIDIYNVDIETIIKNGGLK